MYNYEIDEKDLIFPNMEILTPEVLLVNKKMLWYLESQIEVFRNLALELKFLDESGCEDVIQFCDVMWFVSCEIGQQHIKEKNINYNIWKEHLEGVGVEQPVKFASCYYYINKHCKALVKDDRFLANHAYKTTYLAHHPKDLMNIMIGRKKALVDLYDLMQANLLHVTS